MRSFYFLIIGLCALSSARATITVNPAMPIDRQVTVQLIKAFEDDGTNGAQVFGDSTKRLKIETAMDKIWAQAGIDVRLAPTVTFWNSSFALNGNTSGNRPTGDLNTIFAQASAEGKLNTGNVINAVFVDHVPAFGVLGPDYAAGFASVDGNKITFFTGNSLLGYDDGLEVIARVFAHEIGHNLGLSHTADGSANLMAGSDGTSQQLTAAQINNVRDSSLLTAIPEPGSLMLLVPGLLLVAARRARRQANHSED